MSKLLCSVLKISGGASAPNAPPGCAPAVDYSAPRILQIKNHYLQCTLWSCCSNALPLSQMT